MAWYEDFADPARGNLQGLVNALRNPSTTTPDNSKLANQLRAISDSKQYIRGNLLPFKKDIKTKEVSFGMPTVAQDLFSAISAPIRAYRGEIDPNTPQGVQEAMNVGLNAMGGGLGATAIKPVEKGAIGMFVGTKGIHNLGLSDVLAHANKLKAARVPDEQIWAETSPMIANRGVPAGGITYKFGGEPNLEISDNLAKVNPLKQTDWNYAALPTVLEHPDLYKAVPTLKRLAISPTDESYSFVNPTTREMGIAKDHRTDQIINNESGGADTYYNFNPDVIGHEVQHDIQRSHDMPQGGNQNTQIYLNKVFGETKKEYDPSLKNIEQAQPALKDLYQQKRIQDLNNTLNKSSYKPRDLYGSADFYKHSDQIRSELGQMPKKPGDNRDNYIRNAYDIIYNNYLADNWIHKAYVEQALAKKPTQTKYQIDKLYKQLEPDYQKAREFADLRNSNQSMNMLNPYQVYNNLTGEAQSRLVQKRWDLTPEERAATYPFTKEQLGMNPYDLIDVRYK